MPSIPRRSAFLGLAGFGTAFAAGARAQGTSAQEGWPTRPLRLILPYTPGGGTDAVARTLAADLGARLGQPVVVENRPGAGGNLATEVVATARPDGHTLLMGNQGPMSVNPTLFRATLKLDPATALEPVAMVAETPLVLVVGPATRAATLSALLDEARRGPGALNYASPGNGAAGHLAMVLLLQEAGAEATHVPFRGAAPGLTDVAAGHVAAMVSTLPSVLGLVSGGQLRALAVTAARRVAALPDVPTVAETLPGYRVSAWYGILVPRGTPAAARERLGTAITEALAAPAVLERLRAEGTEPYPMDGPTFGRFIAEERTRWARVVAAAGIVPD